MVTALGGRKLSDESMNPQINTIDFNERPFIAIWEVTQACDLACVHCRASAQPDRDPFELSTDEGKQLIDQIAALKVPVFVLTGGDPIKRPDLFELIAHARSVRVRVSLTPSATPLLTKDIVFRLKEAGLARLALSMDGASAATGAKPPDCAFLSSMSCCGVAALGVSWWPKPCEFCRDKQYGRVFLTTLPGLEAAMHLYTEHGFQQIAQNDMGFHGSVFVEQTFECKLD